MFVFQKIKQSSWFIKITLSAILLLLIYISYSLLSRHSNVIISCDYEAKTFAEKERTLSVEYYKVKYDLAYKLCMRKNGFDE